MTGGGKREGAGRPKGSTKPPEQKTKLTSFRLYPGEAKKIREYLKELRSQ